MDRDSFIAKLFKDEYPLLIRKAYRLTGSKEFAEDMVQDTFLLAVSHYEELINHPSPGGWLTVTLYNLVRNERRKMKNQVGIPIEEILKQQGVENPPSLEDYIPTQLSPDDKKLLLWRYEQQLDYRTIASYLGISEAACRMKVHRITKKCKNILLKTNNTS